MKSECSEGFDKIAMHAELVCKYVRSLMVVWDLYVFLGLRGDAFVLGCDFLFLISFCLPFSCTLCVLCGPFLRAIDIFSYFTFYIYIYVYLLRMNYVPL